MGVIVEKTRRRASEVLANALGWDSYVVAALTLHGTTIGLLHAGMCSADRRVDALDQEVTEIYARGLAESFERAALRQTLQRHRQELQDAVRWMSGRLSSFSADVPLPLTRPTEFDAGLDSLTRREREVLQLLTKGNTNGGIAHALVISEGTAKYHVKNILRKLQATSRAEAVAHYLRGTAGRADV
jgi:DNA-binding NarL/FixJ family response regulator